MKNIRSTAISTLLVSCYWITLSVAQTDTGSPSAAMTVPVTLSMAWERGSKHYGPSFIYLHTPCQDSQPCECTLSFKGTKSKEFADYISSFRSNKVPVVYGVHYGSNGKPQSYKLERVGNWDGERFPHNDQLLGVKVTFRASESKTQDSRKVGFENCFPPGNV